MDIAASPVAMSVFARPKCGARILADLSDFRLLEWGGERAGAFPHVQARRTYMTHVDLVPSCADTSRSLKVTLDRLPSRLCACQHLPFDVVDLQRYDS